MTNPKTRIPELVEYLNQQAHNYYTLDKPTIDDATYDQLYHELKLLEQQNPDLVQMNSPTQRVGDRINRLFTPVVREVPMLSLDNIFNVAELVEWLKAFDTNTNFTVEPKYDGLAISLKYEEGVLVQASTRGDGVIGEDVTENVIKLCKGIPRVIQDHTTLEVRGEVVITQEDFLKINEVREKPFANQRNGAAGSLRTKEVDAPFKYLTFYPYDLVGIEMTSQYFDFDNWRKANSFGIKLDRFSASGLPAFRKRYMDFIDKRNTLPYPIDGIVVKVDSVPLQQQLGEGNRVPRWAIAFKLPAIAQVTTLTDVKWQIGRTGVLTPVAVVEPISIMGTTITNVTLHNLAEIDRLDLHLGDTVEIIRSGDVIPKLTNVISRTSNPIHIPTTCPSCGSLVAADTGRVRLFCTSPNECKGVLVQQLAYAVSRACLDIDGLAEKTIEALVNEGLLKSISDIYQLTVEKLKPITGELIAEKLMKQIEKSRTISFVDFLNTIAIDGVGKGTSGRLASEYVDLNDFMTTDLPRLSTVETVGAKTATAILLHLASDFEEIRKLAKEMTIQYPVKASTKLQGLVFVITGSFPISREEIKKTILANSGTVSGSVSVKTNYLIAGDNTGSKLTKAKQLGVSVISLEEFNKILEVNV